MAIANFSTEVGVEECHQQADIGRPVVITEENHDAAVMLLRVIAEFGNDDTDSMIAEGEPYEALVRRLSFYKQNITVFSSLAREVLGYEY